MNIHGFYIGANIVKSPQGNIKIALKKEAVSKLKTEISLLTIYKLQHKNLLLLVL